MHKKYWNEEIETMSEPAMDRLESERLQKQLPYLYRTSSFYAELFDRAGVKPDSIRNRRDLARVPFTEKRVLADSQKDGSLLGVHQCAPLEKIVRIQATGGTTGQPTRIGFTRKDNADYCEM